MLQREAFGSAIGVAFIWLVLLDEVPKPSSPGTNMQQVID